MQKIIIYGAGVYGKTLCDTVLQQGGEILYFIDEYTNELEYRNIKIKKLKELNSDKSANIFISLALNNVNKIKTKLYENGFQKIFEFEDAVKEYQNFFQNLAKKNLLWMHEDSSALLNLEKIKQVENYLSDEISINLLNKIVLFRKHLSYDTYVYPQTDQVQYFPNDIDLFKGINELKFIDCGAYIGDTILSVINGFKKVDYIIAIEPDTKNLTKLNDEIERRKGEYQDIKFCIYPNGVWSENKILKFSAEGSSASSITTEININSIEITAISLDNTLYGMAPNYIKMDIEGAEIEALLGCQKIIRTYKPILAICVYHKPEHLWEIPILIKELNPDYKMYLRQYGQMGTETVLYCINKSSQYNEKI